MRTVRNVGLFGFAVLVFLIFVYMKANRPVHLPEKIADPIPWTDQLGTVKSFIASMMEQLKDENSGVPPVYKTDQDTDHKPRSDKQLNDEKARVPPVYKTDHDTDYKPWSDKQLIDGESGVPPVYKTDQDTDYKPWSDKQLNDEKAGVPPAGVPPVYKTDQDTDYKHRSDPLTTQPDKSYAEALLDQLNSEKAQQDDPRLIKLIRDHFIEPPSLLPYKLNMVSKVHYSKENQSAIVDTMLNNMETGFFVECGAFDGELLSNTLYFEKTRHWKGLLIEANPINYLNLKKKNRKAFTINACLSVEHYPIKMAFNKHRAMGRLLHDEGRLWMEQHHLSKDEIQLQCFPLYSILLALNQTKVDYLSLDIEGDELYVLKTVPFDKLHFKLMTVEAGHPANRSVDIKAFMGSQGYQYVKNIHKDMVFVNENT